MPVPFGFSVADFLTLGQLAFRVYRSYQDAPSSFAELSDDIKILHVHLQEVADRIAEPDRRILPSQQIAMQEVAGSCQVTLDRLDGIMSQYSAMDMQKQLTWERLRWQVEDQMQIKQDITFKLLAVNSLNQSLSGSSMTKLMLNLQRLVNQAMATRNHGTIVSALTNTDMGSDHLWQSIGRDFQVAGISREMVLTNRDVICEHIQQIFSSGLISTEESDTGSAWDSRSISRAGSTATSRFSPGLSATSTVYESSRGARSTSDTTTGGIQAYSRPKEKKDLQTRRDEPQCPWDKLTENNLQLTNEDAIYRPFVVEIRLVTPEAPQPIQSQSGFSFKTNHVSEHSWVFLRLSQHTREGMQPLSTPDPYNPAQDHGRQFAAKWTEFAFSQALRDWKYFLLPSDQPFYVCMPTSHESVFKNLAKEHPLAYPIIFSFDIGSGAISFWKLAGRLWAGRSSYQYQEKSMEDVPNKGLLQFVKRISLRQQVKAFNLEGARGRGQMLLMLFTQKAVDQTRTFARTWILEQELSGNTIHGHNWAGGLSSQLSSSSRQPPLIQIPADRTIPPIHSSSDSYLAKASAVCGYEGSGQGELCFVIGDEIWVTEYLEVEIWQGTNQRTQQTGKFPRSLVRPITVRKMPSGDKLALPHEIGSSTLSFASGDGLLSPSPTQLSSKPSLQNRTQRSASTGAIPGHPSGPVYHELDSTEIPSPSHLSTHSDTGPGGSDHQLSRGKTTVSDRGPGRTSADYPGGAAYLPYTYQQLPAEPSTGRSGSQNVWMPPSRDSVVSPLAFPSYVGSPYPSGISPAPSLLVSPYTTPAPPSIPLSQYPGSSNLATASTGDSPVRPIQFDTLRYQRPGSSLLSLETPATQFPKAGPAFPQLPSLFTNSVRRGDLSDPLTAPPDFRSGTGWGSTDSIDVPIPILRAQVSAFLERQASNEQIVAESEISSHTDSKPLSAPAAVQTHADAIEKLPKQSGSLAFPAEKSPTLQLLPPLQNTSLLDTPSLMDFDTPLISTEVEQKMFNVSVKAGDVKD